MLFHMSFTLIGSVRKRSFSSDGFFSGIPSHWIKMFGKWLRRQKEEEPWYEPSCRSECRPLTAKGVHIWPGAASISPIWPSPALCLNTSCTQTDIPSNKSDKGSLKSAEMSFLWEQGHTQQVCPAHTCFPCRVQHCTYTVCSDTGSRLTAAKWIFRMWNQQHAAQMLGLCCPLLLEEQHSVWELTGGKDFQISHCCNWLFLSHVCVC